MLVAAALITGALLQRGRLASFALLMRRAASLVVLGSGLVWFVARI